MSPKAPIVAPAPYLELRDRFDDVLRDFLRARRQEAEWIDPRATVLVDEVARLIEAGGKRLRPAFCYWGYRAAGGEDGDGILKAASALELLHTFALIHDDVMDGTAERRGVAASRVRLEGEARDRGLPDPERFGLAVAILAGDLAAVLADQLILEAGFPAFSLTRALARYHEMRSELATGQLLDLSGVADEREARRVAQLKGGYTVERPLLFGAALAGGPMQVLARLSRFGAPLGEAFQLLDDLRDGDAAPGVTPKLARSLVDEAKAALDPTFLGGDAVKALETLADIVAAGS
jgi:geranylgeranyl diphosphate synthase type I